MDLHLGKMDCPRCGKKLWLASRPIDQRHAESVREIEIETGRTVLTPDALDDAFVCECKARLNAVASGPAIAGPE